MPIDLKWVRSDPDQVREWQNLRRRNDDDENVDLVNQVLPMKAGHVFTVEPMINLGNPGDFTWGDNWTAVTTDGKRSSQFEHTILVTETGYELLTARNDEPVMKWDPALNSR